MTNDERKAHERHQFELLAALAPLTIRMLDRQAERDLENEKRFENEPMGEVTWHVHDPRPRKNT